MRNAHITLDTANRVAYIQILLSGERLAQYTATNIDSLEDAVTALVSRGYVTGSEPLSERGRHSIHEVMD